MTLEIKQLQQQIQHNCDIADSKQAGDYTLCIYLLKMREYFRWENALGFNDPIPKKELGLWLNDKERHWESIANLNFVNLSIDQKEFEPFNNEEINNKLIEQGYVYNAGIGQRGNKHFFLGKLIKKETHFNFNILVSGQELARDLTAPPAFTQEQTIYIRRESLRRMIWERVEEWQWKQSNQATNRAMTYYDMADNLDQALEKLTDNELQTVLLHEIGELEASNILGEQWQEMLYVLPKSQAELMARAVKDHIADCTSTLPNLIQQENIGSIHFYFGNFHSMRKQLFPSLSSAYSQWLEDDHLENVEHTLQKACTHWRHVAEEMLDIYQRHGQGCAPYIEKMVQKYIY